ncbi:EthD domain-containing protein [Cadophora sp. MPI-SDFR-AT-0126]|nr:EthD domain-containing protein [Leotiomycetes sp. MPI-SDFR-AT-0126]
MAFRILIKVYRKSGMTPQEFQSHYENTHVPLVKSLAGPQFPLSHTRRYPQRSSDPVSNYATVILSGTQEDFGYDALTEMVFEDEATCQSFLGFMNAQEVKDKIDADCAKFMDLTKAQLVVLGNVVETRRDD